MQAIAQFRLAAETDLAAIIACDPYVQLHPERRELLHRAIADSSVIAAFVQGTAVGFVVLEYNFFGTGFIPLVAVAAHARRTGYGLALMSEAERRCTTHKLFTSTNHSNIAAQGLILKSGFVPSGHIENIDPSDPELIYFKPATRGRIHC
jgi:ribosomal protein S18 acetylase RimI-like enzyme